MMKQRAITRAVAAAAVVVILGTLALIERPQEARGFANTDIRMFVQCGATAGEAAYNKQVDPIVSPNAPSAHMHTFFGSLRQNGNPDYNRMVAGPLESNCDTHRDTAGYWVPTARNKTTGAVVSPTSLNVYYVNPAKSSQVIAIPPDFMAVSNDFEILAPGSNAEAGAGVRIWFRRQCWDGTLHMTSPEQYVAHTLLRTSGCPAGYQLLPKIHYNARFNMLNSLAGWEANAMTGWHGDFWNTWPQDTLRALTVACMRPTSVAAGCGRVSDATIGSLLAARGVPLPPPPTVPPSPSPTPPPVDPAVQAVLDAYHALTPTQRAQFEALK